MNLNDSKQMIRDREASAEIVRIKNIKKQYTNLRKVKEAKQNIIKVQLIEVQEEKQKNLKQTIVQKALEQIKLTKRAVKLSEMPKTQSLNTISSRNYSGQNSATEDVTKKPEQIFDLTRYTGIRNSPRFQGKQLINVESLNGQTIQLSSQQQLFTRDEDQEHLNQAEPMEVSLQKKVISIPSFNQKSQIFET